MTLRDLKIDVQATLGSRYWLVGVTPIREYIDGQRTDKVIGYRYLTCLPERGMDKVGIRIDGKQLMDAPADGGYVEVKYADPEVYIYGPSSQPQVGVRASGVALANAKA